MYQTLVSYTSLVNSNIAERGYIPTDEIPHLGLKGYVVGQSGSQCSTMRVIIKYVFKCKNVR